MNKQNGIDTQLAYVKYTDFNRYDICIYDFNSNTSTNLTQSNQSISGNFDPRWSPDGQQIAWSRLSDKGRNHRLWIMDADGQNAYLTGAEGDIEVPKWSPDGKKIAYTSANKINLYDLKTDITTCLEHTNASSNNFLWSPDSQSVAYVTVFEDFFYLTIGSTVGDHVRRVEKGSFGGIVWSKKDMLYFEGSVIGKQGDNISSLSLDGQANFLMPLDSNQHSIVRIAPDAKQIAYFSFIPIPLNTYTAHPDGKGSLHISDINGQNHKQILRETSPGEINWSHHQTKLAWEANRSGQIHTIDLMSLETRSIGERCGDVAWRP